MPVVINDPVDNFAPPPHLEVKGRPKFMGLLSILFLVIGLGLVLKQVSQEQRVFTQASGGVMLSMLKDKSNLTVGEEFTVNVFLDTKKTHVTDADIYLLFPEELLQAISIDPGIVGPGTALIHLENLSDVQGIIASIKFKALKAGNPSISYTNETVLTDKTQKGQVANLLDKAIGLKFVIQ